MLTLPIRTDAVKLACFLQDFKRIITMLTQHTFSNREQASSPTLLGLIYLLFLTRYQIHSESERAYKTEVLFAEYFYYFCDSGTAEAEVKIAKLKIRCQHSQRTRVPLRAGVNVKDTSAFTLILSA